MIKNDHHFDSTHTANTIHFRHTRELVKIERRKLELEVAKAQGKHAVEDLHIKWQIEDEKQRKMYLAIGISIAVLCLIVIAFFVIMLTSLKEQLGVPTLF
jgi:hypothetical protein